MPEWIEVIIRSFSLLIILFFMTKWLGKKQISQLNIFEYITGIVLGGIVAIHTIDPDSNFIYAILSMFIWFIIPFAVEYISLKSKRFRDLTDGRSTVFIQDGKIMEDNLKQEGYSTDDLLGKLRDNGVFLASDVEFAVLEPSGNLNVLPKKENRPLTAKDLGLKLAPEKEPQTIVMDGEILLESLANLSLNKNWLETELDKQNVSIENVFLAQADNNGQLYLDLYDDKISVPEPTEKALLLANMKKCQADLELFALATENKQSKALYERNSEKLKHAIQLIQPYL
ncbi:DUF421 domain-containing protein [Virgibacillus pantothenticus]|uniref:Membrane protein n=1 Tax=Virgibacillus pantothenticus TaxID=1473 RepID=A0A0L0QN15_VIRPA|nr:DUF421 domain-containing protein [Virgibacillus pantothenticus]KNE20002.1 membrane protein [Virgibacillus pantothenticus]MBU8565027.1 DUF421 domain-containing protein [Virgibacillus pantothenticus]MBU8599334.1 DUF421 domain-containing protein [Virgibacillus pantothenticus]MBU8633263.1 DUF421 domain-containing protein [Virgibacillus pantothenticus]MBU8641076.1 DUF421 domain-containing protein [Virgibacillus pantothenticus]